MTTTTSMAFVVAISMRGERDVGLNDADQLIIRHGLDRINMGVMSDVDLDNMCEYLQRLKIHAPKASKPDIHLGPNAGKAFMQMLDDSGIYEAPKPKYGEPGFTFPACDQCGSTSLRCGCD